jgi:hypothetical protein
MSDPYVALSAQQAADHSSYVVVIYGKALASHARLEADRTYATLARQEQSECLQG